LLLPIPGRFASGPLATQLRLRHPQAFTAPWTLRVDWTRHEGYGFYEYACFEVDVQVRNFVNSSRAQRGLTTSKVGSPDRQMTGRTRWR